MTEQQDPFENKSMWQRESRVRAWDDYERQKIYALLDAGYRIAFKHPRPSLDVFLAAPHYFEGTHPDDTRADLLLFYEDACLRDRKSLLLIEAAIAQKALSMGFSCTIAHDRDTDTGAPHATENPQGLRVTHNTSLHDLVIFDTATVEDIRSYVTSVEQKGDEARERMQGMKLDAAAETNRFFEPFVLDVGDGLSGRYVEKLKAQLQKALHDVFKDNLQTVHGFLITIQERTPQGGPIMRAVQGRNVRGEIIVGLDTDVVAMRQVFGKYKKAQKFSQFS